jgi:GNAT-family acetyltransferase (TIGR03103 family)
MSGHQRVSSEYNETLDIENSPSLKSWGKPANLPQKNIIIDCGWGRLIFAHTFKSSKKLAKTLSEEEEGKRDQTMYVHEPQVLVSHDPENLLLEPAYTFRLDLKNYKPARKKIGSFSIRTLKINKDIKNINYIYLTRGMPEIEPEFLKKKYNKSKFLTLWVAVNNDSDETIAVCMGIDHKLAFDDPENGSSLWSLAVDPQATHPGIGLEMVQHIARHFKKQGRSFLDLSVYHDNEEAISLYEKLGFINVPAYSVVPRNISNEEHLAQPDFGDELTPYSMIIINEARKRGIRIDILDPIGNYFALSYGGTNITCRESLTDMTSSIAISRCRDIRTTAKTLKKAGLNVPDQHIADTSINNQAFMEKHGSIVVKPCIRTRNAGTTVDVQTKEELQKAIKSAKKIYQDVMLREMIDGQNMRILVIGFKVVAAAVRKAPIIVGNGEHTILQLVEKQSRRREQATQGENTIPIDKELSHMVQEAGYCLDYILPKGRELQVRKASNLHFGGTVHDVTDDLHPDLIDAAVNAAYALDTPVVGLDFIVADPSQPEYVIVEANERPHLLNHESHHTAERFIDFLFPHAVARESSK